VKVALALESLDASPRARALALGRRLAGGGELLAAACLGDATADGPELAARLGIREAYFVADAALAKAGSRARAQVLARLLTRVRADLVLVDAGTDGGGGLFSASLAHHGEWPGLFRAPDVTRDSSRPDAVEVTLDLAGARKHLRVDLPAVVSVVGESSALPALDPSLVKSRTFSLADLDLTMDDLVGDPIPSPGFIPVYHRPVVVTTIDDLLR
jgi:electron transfer flavoprotein alpha/beta subunit